MLVLFIVLWTSIRQPIIDWAQKCTDNAPRTHAYILICTQKLYFWNIILTPFPHPKLKREALASLLSSLSGMQTREPTLVIVAASIYSKTIPIRSQYELRIRYRKRKTIVQSIQNGNDCACVLATPTRHCDVWSLFRVATKKMELFIRSSGKSEEDLKKMDRGK